MKNSAGVLAVCSGGLCTLFLCVHGCTEFRITSQEKSIVIGRSMEWGDDMRSHIVLHPRGKKQIAMAPGGEKGLQWKSRYGFVCADAYGIDVVTDGMNEQGLSVGVLFLPGYAEFQTVPEGKNAEAIAQIELASWMLGNFATVEQLRQAIKKIYVWAAPVDLPKEKNFIFPIHFGVYDASGNGIVVEYTKEGLKVFDNEIGVLTNAPTFDWHMTNLRNYVGLSSWAVKPIKIGTMTIASVGQGSGLFGIPGDPTPPSRFVRAATMVHLADKVDNAEEAVTLASHILNTVDIPLGTVKSSFHATSGQDYSQWIVIKDLSHKQFYFRTYKNSTLRKIDLKKLNFSASGEKKSFSIEEGAPSFVDVTERLNVGNSKNEIIKQDSL